MAKQALVIGLGRFGVSVASALLERGVEVLGTDSNEERIQAASDSITEGIILDATNSEALIRTAPDRRDLCICAIGDESIQDSILCTALLREMGAQRIIARASTELQARILRRVGAHEVVDPLRDFGARFASHLLHEGILGEMPLGKHLVLTEMQTTESMVGKSLAELDLPRKGGITVVCTRNQEDDIRLPDPNRALTLDDVLIVVSKPDSVSNWMSGEDS